MIYNLWNYLLFIFQRATWLSLLDILLVAAVVFAVLYLLRDTKALVLLRGVLFLIVYLLTQRVFFIGGAVVCGFYALRHYRLATRQLPGLTSVE